VDLEEDRRRVICVIRTSKHRVEIRQHFSNVILKMGITVDRLKARIAGGSNYFLSVSGEQHASYLVREPRASAQDFFEEQPTGS
jgi:chemotaxis receptor (MCP) glutamine deamidase CheD